MLMHIFFNETSFLELGKKERKDVNLVIHERMFEIEPMMYTVREFPSQRIPLKFKVYE